MKKLNLLFTALLLMCCVGTAKAVEVTIDGIKYDVITDTKQATVISGDTKYSGDIVIPSEITYNNVTYSVTSIGESAFSGCYDLTSITIPNSVTSIKKYAFDGCSDLTSITIPNSVKSIGYFAFFYCSGLKEVHINDIAAWCNIDFGSSDANPLYYAHNLYLNNELITELVIPNSITSIKNYAFYSCYGLTSVTIPNSVTSIGWDAFYGCTGLTSITIPNSVTSIGNKAFEYCSGLTSITIPNSVTSIGDYAFYNCTRLTSVTIPNSVTSIGDNAFDGCTGLTSITIPNSVTSIGYQVFWKCSGLTSITIPNSVKSIGEMAFADCSGLISVTIGNSVTSIGGRAFRGCSNLTDVYCLATNVPTTESDAFSGSYPEYMTLHVPAEAINNYKTTAPWSSFGSIVEIFAGGEMVIDGIKYDINVNTKQATVISGGNYSGDIVIPSEITYNNVTYSVTSIGERAFDWCSGLTSITIPNSVTSIGFQAFYFCTGLTSVTIPNSITSIGGFAFDGCKGLKEVHINDIAAWCSINFDYISNPLYFAHNLYLNNELITELVIPNGVTSIKNYAFEGCSDLKSVTIGNSVTSIGDEAFNGCYGLESIVVDPGNTKYDSRDNCNAIIETESNTLIKGCKNTVIPNSVTSIGGFAFVDCTGLTSITIPNSVTSIGIAAFNASGLTSITIPNSVTSIGDGAFYFCDILTSVTIGNSVKSIGKQVFYGCSNLTNVYCHATNVPSTDSDAFNSSYTKNMKLHVPAEAINSYKTTAPWSSFGSIVEIFAGGEMVIDGIKYDINVNTKQATVISGGNYSGDIVIPSEITYNNVTYSVTSIGESAFRNCTGLTSITIPNSVTSIGYQAFQDCYGLTSITIPNSVTSIGESAFRNCTDLTSITIPNSITSIGSSAFYYCYGLTSVTIGNSVTSIGNKAFYNCFGLTSITIPNSVTSIGEDAFAWCSGLTSITIPNSITSIGNGAFNWCSGIKEVHTNDLTAWCNIDFGSSYANPLSYAHNLYLNNELITELVIPNGVTSIKNYAFYGCSGLTSVTIGNSVTSIEGSAFRGCSNLTDVYCLATNVPATDSDAFNSSYIKNMKLHVPEEAIDSYKTTAPWNSFGNIVAIIVEKPKCAAPVIEYYNGKLSFECETEGAEFTTDVTCSDINKFYDSEINFSATYNISVYATATGYDNSDTVNATLCWIECDCSADDNTTDVINVPAKAVFVTSNNGTINISCSLEGEVVELYTIDAMYIGSTTIENSTATIESGLSKGDIAIIKIAEKSIKVILN